MDPRREEESRQYVYISLADLLGGDPNSDQSGDDSLINQEDQEDTTNASSSKILNHPINQEELGDTTNASSSTILHPINQEELGNTTNASSSKILLPIEDSTTTAPLANIDSVLPPKVLFDQKTGFWFHIKHKIGCSSHGQISVYMAALSQDSRVHDEDKYFAIKFVHTSSNNRIMGILRNEVKTSQLIPYHVNILRLLRTFSYKSYFCVVFPLMGLGSLAYITSAKYPHGLPEDCVVVALKQTLKALAFIHERGIVHRSISAGHIFLNTKGALKLGYSATLYEYMKGLEEPSPYNNSRFSFLDSVSAPEVYRREGYKKKGYHETEDYKQKSDIWLIGVTALELAYGTAVINAKNRRNVIQSIVRKINETNMLPKKENYDDASSSNTTSQEQKKKPSSMKAIFKGIFKGVSKEEEFSKDFEKMVVKCLALDPEARPTSKELLKSEIIKKSRSVEYFHNFVK